jgi:hypothetical protein
MKDDKEFFNKVVFWFTMAIIAILIYLAITSCDKDCYDCRIITTWPELNRTSDTIIDQTELLFERLWPLFNKLNEQCQKQLREELKGFQCWLRDLNPKTDHIKHLEWNVDEYLKQKGLPL